MLLCIQYYSSIHTTIVVYTLLQQYTHYYSSTLRVVLVITRIRTSLISMHTDDHAWYLSYLRYVLFSLRIFHSYTLIYKHVYIYIYILIN